MQKDNRNLHRLKKRTAEEKNYLKKRLHIIEGQVRGLTAMIDDDRYCDEVLIQISAIDHALKSLGTKILKDHLSTCVVDDIKTDHLEVIDEVMDLIKKLN